MNTAINIFGIAALIVVIIGIWALDTGIMLFAGILFVIALALAAVSQDDTPNTSTPTVTGLSWTDLGDGLARACDGKNLVYKLYNKSITVSQNDTICLATEETK